MGRAFLYFFRTIQKTVKIDGCFNFNASRETVWRVLNDPSLIAKHLPGCESMEATGEDCYRAVLKIGVGAIKGTYHTTMRIAEKQPPQGYTLHVEGSGNPGFAKGQGTVRLTESGGKTVLTYSGDLQIGGLIARVGQRIVAPLSQQMARAFFEGLGGEAEHVT